MLHGRQNAFPRTDRRSHRESVHDSQLGAYTEVGARTILHEVDDGRLFLRRERRADHLHDDRKVLLDRGDDADQSGQSSHAPGLAGAFHLSRQQPIFQARATMPNSSHGGASITSISAMTSGSATARSILPGRNDRHRRGDRGRRDRDQGRPGLHHRRRQSGAADQAAVSGRHRRPACGARMVGLGP